MFQKAFTGVLGAISAMGIVIFGIAACICVVCVGFIALATLGQQASDEKAQELNAGFGSLEKPIALGEWIKFDEVDIRPTRLVRPADAMVRSFNSFNNNAADGAEFVLVWFEAVCKVDACDPSGSGFRLVDESGKEWEEPVMMVLNPDFDSQAAVKGGKLEGWQVFQIPKVATIQTIMVRWSFGSWLHTVPPEAE